MSLRPLTNHLPRFSTGRPYARLLCVKMKSGRSYFLSSELWHLLPQEDDVVSVTSALGRPIFAPVNTFEPAPVELHKA